MEIIYLIGAMVLVGALMGWIAGLIWKDNRPYGVSGDYIAAILTAVVFGLLDYFVIPAMNFSETIKWVGIALEPPLGALFVLWLMRRIKR
jgi:uncharacterized membrane protein YeaQ/YmgE (transglycosylase-associated protein family)